MYEFDDGIMYGERLVENASYVFEDNAKDLNFFYSIISDFKVKHPDYISKLEEFYQMDIKHILYKLLDAKDELRRIEKNFDYMVDSINMANRNHPLYFERFNDGVLPIFKPDTYDALKTGSLEEKRQILLDYITICEKINEDNLYETMRVWDNPSRKNFERDIYELREDSIGYIKRGLLAVATKENSLEVYD